MWSTCRPSSCRHRSPRHRRRTTRPLPSLFWTSACSRSSKPPAPHPPPTTPPQPAKSTPSHQPGPTTPHPPPTTPPQPAKSTPSHQPGPTASRPPSSSSLAPSLLPTIMKSWWATTTRRGFRRSSTSRSPWTNSARWIHRTERPLPYRPRRSPRCQRASPWVHLRTRAMSPATSVMSPCPIRMNVHQGAACSVAGDAEARSRQHPPSSRSRSWGPIRPSPLPRRATRRTSGRLKTKRPAIHRSPFLGARPICLALQGVSADLDATSYSQGSRNRRKPPPTMAHSNRSKRQYRACRKKSRRARHSPSSTPTTCCQKAHSSPARRWSLSSWSLRRPPPSGGPTKRRWSPRQGHARTTKSSSSQALSPNAQHLVSCLGTLMMLLLRRYFPMRLKLPPSTSPASKRRRNSLLRRSRMPTGTPWTKLQPLG